MLQRTPDASNNQSARPPRLWPDNERSDAAAGRLYYNQLAGLKPARSSDYDLPFRRKTVMAEYAALIGIDWSDRKHDLSLVETASGRREASVLPHSPQEIDEWATDLRARYGGRPVAVCLEQSRGPLISALLKYD